MPTKMPIDKRVKKELWINTYQDYANSPDIWFWYSLKLAKSANLIWEEYEKYNESLAGYKEAELKPVPFSNKIALMLYGLAVENAIKSLIISKQGGVNEKGNFNLNSHCLVLLSENAGIALDNNERVLLEKLQQFIEWGSRYPNSLYFEEMRPKLLPDKTGIYLSSVSTTDREQSLKFIIKIRAMLGIEILTKDNPLNG